MPHPTTAVAVRHPESGQFIALDPAVNYADDDILVREFGWAFVVQEKPEPAESVRVVPVEQATAAPGEKRNRFRL